MSLAVQIVNYDTAAWLGDCLESVLAAAPAGTRVLVLDNASSDDLGALRDRFPQVRFAESDRNLGFGGGHNRLAGEHDAELLCLVNPDVVVEGRGVFERLTAVLADPGVGVVGPLLRTPGGEPQPFDHGELRGPRAWVAARAGHAHWRPRDRTVDAAWVSGAFLLVRRAAFDAVGGFDEGFFLYKEEEDLCRRVRAAGWRVRYVPEAEVRHVGGVVAGRDPQRLAESVARFREKHAPRWRLWDPLYRHVTRRI